MAVATGEGSEMYAPMGQVIVGGLFSSTVITLLIIPVLYELLEKKKNKNKKIKAIEESRDESKEK